MESKEKRRALIGHALGQEVLTLTDAIADLQALDEPVPAHLWRSLAREISRSAAEVKACPRYRGVYYRLRDALWNRQFWHKDKMAKERLRRQCLQ